MNEDKGPLSILKLFFFAAVEMRRFQS